MPTLGEKIKTHREQNGLSQEQLATMLWIGRLTLLQMESDKRQPKAEELKTLSQIFDISVDFLLNDYPLPTEKPKITADMKKKFEYLMLYILSKVGGQHNVGKVVLYKLLYFAEFDYYELYQKHLSGYPFIRLPMGPAPYNFNTLVETMEEKKLIATIIVPYYNQYQQRFIANIPVTAEKRFSPEERRCIDDVLERYSDLWATEISEKSHQDKPRQLTLDMAPISYESVKFREYPFSPLARAQKKKEAQEYAMKTGFFADLADEPDLYEEYR